MNANTIIMNLLVSARLRIARHLILLAFVSIISLGFIWFLREQEQLPPFESVVGLLLFIVVLLGGCYLNIYILIPRLLVKNKGGIYVAALCGLVLAVIVVVMLVQTVYAGGGDSPSEEVSPLIGIVNLLSSILAFFFLFAGTTTLVLFKYWMLDRQQAEALESATLQLELKLLENQINPHFLFNMLNNANIMIKKEPDTAVHIIAKLGEMLRYQMGESTREKVCLRDEINFLNDLLELEKTRRDYFSYTIAEDGEVNDIRLPPLLFVTFVENAVKHSQDSLTASYVHLSFNATGGRLVFICENSIPQKPSNNQVGGIGLANIRRRLDLLFKDSYSLEYVKTDTNYTVKLTLKI